MNSEEKCLISRIENLRKQLNQNNLHNRPETYAKTYALSLELDKLIFKYMIGFQKIT